MTLISPLREEFRKLEPFYDKKKAITLNVIVHFFVEVKTNKIEFTDYLFSLENKSGKESASGRFQDKEKIRVEKGKLTKVELAFLRRTANLLNEQKVKPTIFT